MIDETCKYVFDTFWVVGLSPAIAISLDTNWLSKSRMMATCFMATNAFL